MMKSKLATAIALVGLMQTSVLYALGLGDIRVSSAVNERLDAEIPLINADGLDASQVLVSLASKADFSRAGVDRNYFLSSLEFIVERGESGTPILRLQTPDVVLEPYLNFLVELRWPKGRLLREYTVLLDLPNYSAAPARAMNPVTVTDIPPVNPSNKKVTKTSTQSFTPSSPSSTNQSPQNKASANTLSNVTVRADETLWGIAKRVKPNGASINQTMLALQDLNPNAFINNNINLLKKGAVLRLPEDATVSRVSDKEAQQLMAKQQAVPLLASQAADLKATQDARESSQVSASESAVLEGRLQLATVDSSLASTALSGVDTDTINDETQLSEDQGNLVEINRLRNELAISLENLDRAAVENTSMDARLVAMESQLSDLEQLVSLKDQELASMRLAIEARRAALDATQVNAPSSKSKPSTPVVDAGPLEVIASALSISVAWVIGIGVTFFAAVTAILMWFFARRDDAYEATVFERVEPLADEDELEGNFYADKNARLNTDNLDQQKINTKQDLSDQNANDDVLDNSVGHNSGRSADHNEEYNEDSDDSVLADGNAVASNMANDDYDAERDVIAEADIYLAYGRYDQASDMLAAAIEHEPARIDLQLKQLELFVAQQAPDLFRNACLALLTQDPSTSAAAEALLSDIENVCDWWPEGDFAAPAETFVDRYIDDVEEGELEKSEESETDGSNVGLQLAYDADADSEIESEEGDLEADVGNQNRNNDEVGTKLDLARAYIDMGDIEGAREILDEVMSEGSEEQRDQANAMIGKIA